MRLRKIIISILLAGLIGSMAMPVYANVPPEEVTQEGQGTDPQIPVIVGETATESMPESVPSTRGEELEKERDGSGDDESEDSPLTPDGNLTLVDDIGSAEAAGKQFITLVTKNGNYFYLIIDRDDKGENTVHFLNQVDEEDLFALLDDEDAEALRDKFSGDDKDEIETVITPFVPSPIPTEVPEVVVKENDSKGVLIGSIFCIAVVGALAAVIFIIMRKKKAEEAKPDPDADYHDEDDEYYADDHEEGYDSREPYDEDDE